MNVGVDPAGGQQHSLPRDDLGGRADRDGHARLDIGITRLTDDPDVAIFQAHIRLDDAPVIDDQCIGNDGVGHVGTEALALPHAIADHLAAAEFHFLAIHGEILFHLHHQGGVGQPDTVAHGGTEHLRVGLARDLHSHYRSPMILPWKPNTLRKPAYSTKRTLRA